ncbi:MAG: hypothetical protein ACKVW3_06790 [Phycisphaerales bacterium]
MMIAALVLVASVGFVRHDHSTLDQRPIATRADYPSGMADSVNRPGFNGRLWVTTPIIGGSETYAVESGNPGAEAYGAAGAEDARVYARVGHQVVSISAWERQEKHGLKRFEEARNFWLKEQGYTGGVRTFVNDAYLPRTVAAAGEAEGGAASGGETGGKAVPEPRATIRLPGDVPRSRGRLRVDADGVSGQMVGRPVLTASRVSWPLGVPGHVAAGRAAIVQAPVRAVAAK